MNAPVLPRLLRRPYHRLPTPEPMTSADPASAALGRNNWLFAVGLESAENTAVAYTRVQTAKLHGADPEAYLAWAMERVAGGRKDPAVYAKHKPAGYQDEGTGRMSGATTFGAS